MCLKLCSQAVTESETVQLCDKVSTPAIEVKVTSGGFVMEFNNRYQMGVLTFDIPIVYL